MDKYLVCNVQIILDFIRNLNRIPMSYFSMGLKKMVDFVNERAGFRW